MSGRLGSLAAAVLAFGVLCGAGARADVLWYNGDFDNLGNLTNEFDTIVSDAMVYDDFIVTDAAGWLITSVWSNNLMDFTTDAANWEIRSGVSVGDGGTLIASGTRSLATQTATGRSAFGSDESTIEVSGLSILLGPGTYWLGVAPIGSGSGRSFISSTSGDNSVGTPPGNDANSFLNSSFFGSDFTMTSNVDFSMGVAGQVVPEPSTVALLSCGLGLLALPRLRRRGRSA